MNADTELFSAAERYLCGAATKLLAITRIHL